MNVRQTISNVKVAFLAQGVSMALSATQSLIVPKLLGVEEYGYWQLYIFYVGYVGFFHFGLNDGVYLLKGGESRSIIDKISVNSQFVFSLVYETLTALCILAIGIVGDFDKSRTFVIACTAVCLVVQNAASYFAYVLQAMNETKLSSYSAIVSRLSFFVLLLALLVMGVRVFQPFVIAFGISMVLQLAYCCWHCRDILSSGFMGWRQAAKASLASISVGSKLMLANIASQLILGILRLAIDARWDVEVFGKLSLSLSLVNFFLAFVTQAAMVLFPALRQSDKGEVKEFYEIARDTLGIAFPVVYLLYFPLAWILGLWLPAYAESIRYLIFLIPICVFDSKMNITCTTLFKVRRQESLLLKINLVTSAACVVMVGVGVFVIGSVEFAVGSATLAIMGRSVISELLVTKDIEARVSDISLFEVGLTAVFVVLAHIMEYPAACGCYAMIYAAFLFLHKRDIVRIQHALKL